MRLAALLAAVLSFALGTALGAALQRWGDGVRRSGHLGTAVRPDRELSLTEMRYYQANPSWTEPAADEPPILAYADLAGNVYTDWGVST